MYSTVVDKRKSLNIYFRCLYTTQKFYNNYIKYIYIYIYPFDFNNAFNMLAENTLARTSAMISEIHATNTKERIAGQIDRCKNTLCSLLVLYFCEFQF